jgi:hypothetical protein
MKIDLSHQRSLSDPLALHAHDRSSLRSGLVGPRNVALTTSEKEGYGQLPSHATGRMCMNSLWFGTAQDHVLKVSGRSCRLGASPAGSNRIEPSVRTAVQPNLRPNSPRGGMPGIWPQLWPRAAVRG